MFPRSYLVCRSLALVDSLDGGHFQRMYGYSVDIPVTLLLGQPRSSSQMNFGAIMEEVKS